MAKPKGTAGLRDRREHEDQRTPSRPGEPPRPATEPPGAEGSAKTPKTATDPATGEPTRKPDAKSG